MPHPLLQSTIDVVTAHMGHNPVPSSDVPGFIRSVYQTLTELDRNGEPVREMPRGNAIPIPVGSASEMLRTPAVPVSESIDHEYIVCLEDGKRLRMLKRYLMSQYGMTPETYRAKWGLTPDYPMVAPAVSEQRKAMASAVGLGKSRVPSARGTRRMQKPRP